MYQTREWSTDTSQTKSKADKPSLPVLSLTNLDVVGIALAWKPGTFLDLCLVVLLASLIPYRHDHVSGSVETSVTKASKSTKPLNQAIRDSKRITIFPSAPRPTLVTGCCNYRIVVMGGSKCRYPHWPIIEGGFTTWVAK